MTLGLSARPRARPAVCPPRTLAVLVALAAAAPAVARGQAADLAGLLDEPVVSTASRRAETAQLAPASTSVITGDALRAFGFTGLDEALAFLAGGVLPEPGLGTVELGARGVLFSGDYGNHVLILLDGHALNEPWDGTAYYDRSAAIPLDLVDHVEVMLGPGSVLYGSSAMLAVIHVKTKRPEAYRGLHLAADAGFPGFARAAVSGGAQFELLGEPAGLVAGVDVLRAHGPSLAYEVQPAGDAGTWGGQATHRAVDVPAAYARLTAGDLAVAVRAASARRAATNMWGSFDDPGNAERDRWLDIDLQYGRTLAPGLALAARAYADLYDYRLNSPSGSPLDCPGGEDACVYHNADDSRWGGLELSLTRDWGGDGRLVTLVGGEGRRARAASYTSYDLGAGAMTVSAYDRTEDWWALYLQQLVPLGAATLNAGLRVDGATTTHLSPRVALVVSAWSGGTLKLVYAEAFRAPSFYERYYSDAVQLPAPDLRPETVRSIEAVAEHRAGAQRFAIAAYRTWWRDGVLTVPASPAVVAAAVARGQLEPDADPAELTVYANVAQVDAIGVDLSWEGTSPAHRLRYGASLTLAHASADLPGVGTTLPAAAGVFGNAHLVWSPGGRWPVAALALRAVGPRPVSGPFDGPAQQLPAAAEARAALSGPVAGGLSWRVAATAGTARQSAHVVGPASMSAGPAPLPLDQLSRWSAIAGLRYDLE